MAMALSKSQDMMLEKLSGILCFLFFSFSSGLMGPMLPNLL
jgi:hypothetical protein